MTVQQEGSTVVDIDQVVRQINQMDRKDVLVGQHKGLITSCRPQVSKRSDKRLLVIGHKIRGFHDMKCWVGQEGEITIHDNGVLKAPGQEDLMIPAFA